MRSKSIVNKSMLSGVTIGGSGGGQPIPLLIVTIVVVAMALVTVWESVTGGSSSFDPSREIPFKCTSCAEISSKTLGELRDLQKDMPMGGPMEAPKYDCPKCGKKALTQAVKCPECEEVFIIAMDPTQGMYDDKCPKCSVSYAEAWRKAHKK